MNLHGKTVLVTGAAHGLGCELANLLNKEGCSLILVDRDIMTIDPESFKDTRVLWTLFEGRIVYNAKSNP